MIKVDDIVRVTNWERAYITNDAWFIEHKYELPLEWLIKYAFRFCKNYLADDNTRYKVLFIDHRQNKVLIGEGYERCLSSVYLIGIDGVELYDKPTKMTISEIEEKLGIKNLKIIKEK